MQGCKRQLYNKLNNMQEIKTTIYKCDFCPKYYRRKHFTEKHEKSCKNNPDNYRACHSCKNLTMESVEMVEELPYDYYEYKVNALLCKKKECYVYPPKVEHKGNYYKDLELLNMPMPKVCKDIDFPPFVRKEIGLTQIDKINLKRHKFIIEKR